MTDAQPLDITELTNILDARFFHGMDVRITNSTLGNVGIVLVDKSNGNVISEWMDPLFYGPALVKRLIGTFPQKVCPWHSNKRNANSEDCNCAAVLASRIEAAIKEINQTNAVGGTR